ncbi:hypothetical protein AAHC03_024268 [Spirometra sp. Aus1]
MDVLIKKNIFRRTVSLLKDPHTDFLYDRHILNFRKIFLENSYGLNLQDLDSVSELIKISCSRLHIVPDVYEQILLEVIRLCGIPFKRSIATDEENYLNVVEQIHSQLASLLKYQNLQGEICRLIHSLLLERCPSFLKDEEHVSFTYLLSALARSSVTESLCQLLKTPQRQKLQILENLRLLSSRLTTCCEKIIRSNCLSAVCVGEDPTCSDELLRLNLDIFINILDNVNASDLSAFSDQLLDGDVFGFLRGAFLHHLAKSRVQKSRQLRNDILAFVVHLTCFLRQAAFTDQVGKILDQLSWDFLRNLLDILVGFRSKGLTDIFNRVQLPPNEENFELTKLLFTFFTNVSNNEGIVGMLSEDGFLETCLGFLEPLPPHHFPAQYLQEENQDGGRGANRRRNRRGVRTWSPLLLEDLQLHVLDCLAESAPRLWATAVAENLLTQILLLLNWCISDGHLVGVLLPFSHYQSKGAVDQGVIESLVEILACSMVDHDSGQTPTDALNPPDEATQLGICASPITTEIQCDILLILALICEGDVHWRELFGKDGTNVLLCLIFLLPEHLAFYNHETLNSKFNETWEMKLPSNADPLARIDVLESLMSSQPIAGGAGVRRLAVCTVNALWVLVAGCELNAAHFLRHDGVQFLLRLLEWYPRGLCGQILSCLTDLCTQPEVTSALLSWRGLRTLPPFPLDDTDCVSFAPLPDRPTAGSAELSEDSVTQLASPNTELAFYRLAPLDSSSFFGQASQGPSLPSLLCWLWRRQELLHKLMAKNALGETSDRLTDVLSSEETVTSTFESSWDTTVGVEGGSSTQATTDTTTTADTTVSADGRPANSKTWIPIKDHESLFSTIYALFTKLGFEGHHELNAEELVTKAAIENFLNVKVDDTMRDVSVELAREDVRPVTPDQDLLRQLSKVAEERKQQLRQIQVEIIQEMRERDIASEMEYYSVPRELRHREEMVRRELIDFIARTSNHAYLRLAKAKQEISIARSRFRNSPTCSDSKTQEGSQTETTSSATSSSDISTLDLDGCHRLNIPKLNSTVTH